MECRKHSHTGAIHKGWPERESKKTKRAKLGRSYEFPSYFRGTRYYRYCRTGTGKKTPGGAGTHTGHTGHADAQRHTDESHNQPNPPTTHTPRTSARQPKPRRTQQPQARSRPLPAADSEEATPSEPDPASARSQSASPRLLEGGRRNEGACGRRVTAGTRNGTVLGVFFTVNREDMRDPGCVTWVAKLYAMRGCVSTFVQLDPDRYQQHPGVGQVDR